MVRSFFSQGVGLVVTGVVSVILTPILVHDLGSFYYGLWILVTSLLDYYGLLDMGIGYTLQRFVGRYHGAGDRKGLNETLSTATLAMTAIGLILLGASVILAFTLPQFFKVAGANRLIFRDLVLLIGISIAVVFPARVLSAYVCGLQRFDIFNIGVITSAVLRAVFFVVVLDWGLGVIGIAKVSVGIAFYGLAINYGMARWADRNLSIRWRLASWARLRELGHFSVYVFVGRIGDQLRFYTDSIVIARVLSVALTTPFDIVTRLTRYYNLAFYPVSGPLMTAMSSIEGQGHTQLLNQVFLKVSKLTCLIALLGGALLILHGRAVLRLWVGSEFEPAYVLLVILVVGYALALSQTSFPPVLYAKARHRAMAIWTVCEGGANLLLSIYWATHPALARFLIGGHLPKGYYRLAGVALGTAVPMIVIRLSIQPWYVLHVAGIHLRKFVAKALARPLLAFIPFIAVSIIAQSPWMGATIPHLAITVIWESVLFVALAYVIALDRADRKDVRQRAYSTVRRLTGRSAVITTGTAPSSTLKNSEESGEILTTIREKTEDEAKWL